MSATDTRSKLLRWRTARHVVLGAIVFAGSIATSAAVVQRMATHDCDAYQQLQVQRAYTYSGIGVIIESEDDRVVVRRVLPGAPAEGKLFPGAHLIAVGGETPETLSGWADAIRGEPGTPVALEVAYPCGGHKTVTITRDVLRFEY